MEKKLIILGLMTSLLIFTTCTDDDKEKPVVPPTDHLTLKVSLEKVQDISRRWSEEDILNVNNKQYRLSTGAGSTDATFEEVEIADQYNAFFPVDLITSNGSTLSLTIPAKQSYIPNTQSIQTFPWVGKSTDDYLSLQYTGGILKISIIGNRTLKSVTLTGNNNEKLSGSASIAMNYTDHPVLKFATDANNSITLDCNEGIKLSGTAISVSLSLPVIKFEKGISLSLLDTEDREMTYQTEETIVIERNKTTFLTPFEYIPEPVPQADWLWMTSEELIDTKSVNFKNLENAINLSANDKFANCYIVNTGGNYKFKAVKPDGSPIEGLSEDTYVYFTASANKGNAVIGAFNAAGKIVWSWHIWMTDQPQDFAYPSKLGPIQNVVLMDRNLGAVSAIPSEDVTQTYGLMYQWGRKDPIYGGSEKETLATSFDRARENTVVNTAYPQLNWDPVNRPDVEGGINIAYTIEHPMTFIYTKDKAIQDWLIPQDDNLWGHNASKTIYDPCPAGYRVPESGAYFDIWIGPFIWDKTYGGRTYSHSETAAASWFPAQGMRWGDDYAGFLSTVRSNGMYWTCTPATENNIRFGQIMSFTNTTSMTQWARNYYRIMGFTIRCCKE